MMMVCCGTNKRYKNAYQRKHYAKECDPPKTLNAMLKLQLALCLGMSTKYSSVM